jgi:MFS family permease
MSELTTATAGPSVRPRWNVVLLIVLSITLVEVMGTMSLGPALPGIAATFALSEQQVGWITTAFVVPIIVCAPIVGLLADRFGRRAVLVPSLLVFGVAGTAARQQGSDNRGQSGL